MTPYQLAIANLFRRKLPTCIALISISLSVAFSGTLFRLYLLSNSRFKTMAVGPEVVIGAKAGGIEMILGSLNLEGPYPDFIPYKLYAALKARDTVQFEDGAKATPSYIRSVIPLVYFGKYNDYRVIGTNEDFIKRPSDTPGIQLKEGTWATAQDGVVLGAEVARREGLKVGETLVVQGWTSKTLPSKTVFSLKVSGILEPTGNAWDKALYTSLEKAWATLAIEDLKGQSIWKEQVLHYFLVYVPKEGFADISALINQRTVAQAVLVDEQLARLEDLTGSGKRLGFLLSVLILLLGALGVTSMMVVRFETMTVQFAVLRAIGFKKSEIRSWLLWEGLLIGSSACTIGAAMDALFFPLLRHYMGSALPAVTQVASPLYLSAPVWGMAIFGTVLATLIPLYRLYNVDIHTALKG